MSLKWPLNLNDLPRAGKVEEKTPTEELPQVRGPVSAAFRLRHTQSLFTALDNCRDIVQITDSEHKVA